MPNVAVIKHWIRYLMRKNHTLANGQSLVCWHLLTHAQELSSKCSLTVQDNRNSGVSRWSRVGGAHFSNIKGTFFLRLTNHYRQILISEITFKQERSVNYIKWYL